MLKGLEPAQDGNTTLAQEVLHTEQKQNHSARVDLQT